MLLSPSDPDIDTIVRRIDQGDLDLQPDFQRGEVWSINKKRKLIDSILRNWYIPPVHTILIPETKKQDVLDGQQRLAAIRDFVRGEFVVDGFIPPINREIGALDGLHYRRLPPAVKRGFDAFTIRVIRISEYAPEEPGELFFRLNTLTSITSAEQRNAFYGPVRNQVKELVVFFESQGNEQTTLGFSNSRMAYDDVLSKLMCSLETEDLTIKLTAGMISDRFRSLSVFPSRVISLAMHTLEVFSILRQNTPFLRLNKATLLSWLIVIAAILKQTDSGFLIENDRNVLAAFEKRRKDNSSQSSSTNPSVKMSPLFRLISVYNDRSTSRVSDVSSVMFRDFIINYYIYIQVRRESVGVNFLKQHRLSELEDLRMRLKGSSPDDVDSFLSNELNFDAWGHF